MKLENFSACIFDLDGTLLDSAAYIMDCLYTAFLTAGIQAEKSNFTAERVGPPIRAIIHTIAPNLSPNMVEQVAKKFRTLYDDATTDNSCLYSEIKPILLQLYAQKIPLFIATCKPLKATLRLVKEHQLEFMTDVYTPDRTAFSLSKTQMIRELILKYRLDPATTIMLGDTLSDLTAAKEAGIKAGFCVWGYGKNKEVLAKEADFIYFRPEDFLK